MIKKIIFILICIESSRVVTERQFFETIESYLHNVNKKTDFEFKSFYLDHSIKRQNEEKIYLMLKDLFQKYELTKNNNLIEYIFYISHDDDKKEDRNNIDKTLEMIKSKIQNFTSNIEFKITRIFDIGKSFDYFIYQLFNNLKEPTNKELDSFVKTKNYKKTKYNLMNDLKIIVKENNKYCKQTHIEIIKLCSKTKSKYSDIFKEILKYIDL